MCYHLKTSYGTTEAVIDDNCGISKFYMIADVLSDELKVKFINQIDDADALCWDFKYKKHYLTLQYSIFNGVSIIPHPVVKDVQTSDKIVREISGLLVKKAF
ncbi:MAG: hypothetical protein H3C36_13020 [Chitinophagaceae bacterium]|nr:hypothetical protein [Chitinophagaceae bacterium]MCO5285246.1 hypothetical protein [Chitinophagaceae bacterium]MCW5913229.1 hypothetical protein [Chitinophagaceae bacterium]MCZ2397021.1 hypothetical protein [Chitinophagales bacterium]